MEQVIKKEKKTFSNFLRLVFKRGLEIVGSFLIRLGLTPNKVSLIGLLGTVGSAIALAMGHMTVGGILVGLMGLVDTVDGAMARLKGETSRFGAFFDSVIDRYSDLIVLGGLLVFYTRTQNWQACLLVYVASIGSVVVSYIRARAESLDLEAEIGVLTRLERHLVLVPALILNHPIIGLWIIAVMGNFTALQRIWHVWKQSRK